MERHKANEARIIPILLRACDWSGAPFEALQVLPRNHLPLASWRNRDTGFTEIAREIRSVLNELELLTVGGRPTRLPRIWQILSARNPVFTGRMDILKELHGSLSGLVTDGVLVKGNAILLHKRLHFHCEQKP